MNRFPRKAFHSNSMIEVICDIAEMLLADTRGHQKNVKQKKNSYHFWTQK